MNSKESRFFIYSGQSDCHMTIDYLKNKTPLTIDTEDMFLPSPEYINLGQDGAEATYTKKSLSNITKCSLV